MLSSAIESVQIYRSGAIVERTAILEKNDTAFPEEVFIGSLPLTLQDQSLKVWCSAEGEATAIPVASGSKVSLQHIEAVEELEGDQQKHQQIKELNERISSMQEQSKQIMESIKKIDALSMPRRPKIETIEHYTESPQDARLELFEFLDVRRESLLKSYLAIVDETIILKREREALEDSVNNVANIHRDKVMQHLKKMVAVRLRNCESEITKLIIHVEYQVHAAAWCPAYSLHVQNDEQARLEMRALIVQNSGEDWDDVKLSLSTAHLQQWCELPEMQSLRIGKPVRLPPKPGYREPPQGTEELFLDYDQFQASYQILAAGGYGAEETAYFGDLLEGRGVPAPAGGAYAAEEPVIDAMLDDISESMDLGELSASAAPAYDLDEFAKARRTSRKIAAPLKKSRSRSISDADLQTVDYGDASLDTPAMLLSPPPAPEPIPSFELIQNRFLNFNNLYMPNLFSDKRGSLQVRTSRFDYDCSEVELAALDMAMDRYVPRFPKSYVTVGESDSFDYAYACEHRINLKSDAKFSTVAVTDQVVPMSVYYVAVPREGQEVFRMAHLKNPFINPLLPGPLDLYKNDEFFITSKLDLIASGGDLDIGLGVENGIKVARNTDYTEASSGLLSGHLSLKHNVQIDVQNNLDHRIKIEVRERIPITGEKEEQAEVKVTMVNPEWKSADKDLKKARGRHHWTLHVDAHEKGSASLSYQIEMSSKNEIVGGNRREG